MLTLFGSFFFFSTPLTIAGFNIDMVVLPILAMLIYLSFNVFRAKFNNDFIIVTCILFSYFCLSIIFSLLHAATVVNVINFGLLKIFLFILFGYVMAQKIGTEKALLIICVLYWNVFVINTLVIAAQFTMPEFKLLIEDQLYKSSEYYSNRDDRYRGLAAGGGASLSFSMGIGIIVGYFLKIEKHISAKYFWFGAILMTWTIFLVGKSGFAVILIFAILKSLEKGDFKLLFVFMFVVALTVLFRDFLPDQLIRRNFAYFSTGSDASLRGLSRIYDFTSLDWDTIFVGNGSADGRIGPLVGDPGYYKAITLFGLPVAVLFYFSFFLILLSTIGTQKSFGILLVIAFFIFEAKEPLLFKGYAMRFLWLLVGVKLAVNRPKINNKLV